MEKNSSSRMERDLAREVDELRVQISCLPALLEKMDSLFQVVEETNRAVHAVMKKVNENLPCHVSKNVTNQVMMEASSLKGIPIRITKENNQSQKQKQQESQGYQVQKQARPRNNLALPNFGMTNTQLLENLCQQNLLSLRPLKPLAPPYPLWYDPTASCIYHMGAKGHTIDTCNGFRKAVLHLMDLNVLHSNPGLTPNIQNNPQFDHHKGKGVCVLKEGGANLGKESKVHFLMVEDEEGFDN